MSQLHEPKDQSLGSKLPVLSDELKRQSLYHVPFHEAFGKPHLEILLQCRACGESHTYAMWEWCGEMCFDCGAVFEPLESPESDSESR